MKIVVIQSGEQHEVFPVLSLLIGLQKAYHNSKVIWIGNPLFFDLIKYNKRIQSYFDVDAEVNFDVLSKIFKPDICINPFNDKKSCAYASVTQAKKYHGFNKNGPVDRTAEFFDKVKNGTINTNKNILDLYYGLADLKWHGEGYGLSYYPKSKQIAECGKIGVNIPVDDCDAFKLPRKLLPKFDTINKYSHIHTDDLFVLHAGLALRKNITFYSKPLSYKLEFFKKGKLVTV